MNSVVVRRINDFTKADFIEHPVWICAYNTDIDLPGNDIDEATFRPWEGRLPFDSSYFGLGVLARADISLADGAKSIGFCALPRPQWGESGREVSRLQPSIFVNEKIVDLYAGSVDQIAFDNFKSLMYSRLGRQAAAVFPVDFSITDSVCERVMRLKIMGFSMLEFPSMRLRVET